MSHNAREDDSKKSLVYLSKIRIERIEGPLRIAYLPPDNRPVRFGVHSGVAEHYNRDPNEEHADTTTLDYIIAAAGGWLTGTLGGALDARGINGSSPNFSAETSGEIVNDGKTIIIKSIHVDYHLKIKSKDRVAAERAHSFHASHCPVARTLEGSVKITTQLHLDESLNSNKDSLWIKFCFLHSPAL